MSKGTFVEPTAVKPGAVDPLTSIFRYADGCTVNKTSDTRVTLNWDNGAAVKVTRGAAPDFIRAHMFMHVSNDGKIYGLAEDFAAMTKGGVKPMLAWVICMLRKMIYSLPKISLNMAECISLPKVEPEVEIGAEMITAIEKNAESLNVIVQQAFSILILNGISLLAKGHHYQAADNAWTRFMISAQLEDVFGKLKITGSEGDLFHDALHPFDYDWVAGLVVDKTSDIASRVNGSVKLRMNVLPAGCTSISLIHPLYDEITTRNQKFATIIAPILPRVDAIEVLIRKRPLDYCIHLSRAGTTERVDEVRKFEGVVALMSGYLKALIDAQAQKKVTILKAESLKGVETRRSQAVSIGRQAASVYTEETVDADAIIARVREVLDFTYVPESGKEEVK